ncbi:MAG: sigma-70 family RNA polymerase sigma factor [Myxococcales bacterium]|nr:sigma-70 family RNA polymerase sigma factor [Myxococcales bacterium]
MPDLMHRIAQARDRAAFAELFERLAPRLWGYFRRSGFDGALCDEMVQEVMTAVWHKAEQFDPSRAAVSTWVYAIARNARADHLRRPRFEVDPLDPAYVDGNIARADDDVHRLRMATQVREALQELPDDQLQVLTQAYFEHKSLATIASESGVALGTVKSRVRLAFGRLRGMLGSTR